MDNIKDSELSPLSKLSGYPNFGINLYFNRRKTNLNDMQPGIVKKSLSKLISFLGNVHFRLG